MPTLVYINYIPARRCRLCAEATGCQKGSSGPTKFGFIDRTGKRVIPASLGNASDFHEGLATFQLPSSDKNEKQKFGFIDKTGKVVIPPRFAYASIFSEGLAAVQETAKGKWGFIDRSGNYAIPAQFAYVSDFAEGLAGCERGYIDKKGEVKIFSNRGGSKFSCGLAVREINSLSHTYYQVKKDGTVYADNRLFGYIDRSGSFAILPQFLKGAVFSDDCAVIEAPMTLPPDRSVTGSHGCYGFIDKTGTVITMLETMIEPHNFHEGLAAVHLNHPQGWGYINKKGYVAIEPQFKNAGDFSEGLAAVDGGYIDKSGHKIIETNEDFLSHEAFSEGLAAVTYLQR